MRERPILFSGPMVRAILEGRKTVTRRLVTPRRPLEPLGGQGEHDDPSAWGWPFEDVRARRHGYMVLGRGHDEREPHGRISIASPYGEKGDRLWVRETVGPLPEYPEALTLPEYEGGHNPERLIYRADQGRELVEHYAIAWDRIGWKPSIFMPRWACRIVLEVVDVRVERLQAITPQDVALEGADVVLESMPPQGDVSWFAKLWDSLNAKRGAPWASNPWVWRVEFRRVS